MAEPQTVLHVIGCLNVGGTERQMCELLRRLDRRRWRPLVATFQEGGELLPLLRELEVPVRVFPLKGSLGQLNTARQVMRMAWLCRRERVRIVHAHDFYSNVVGIPAAATARVRAIASRRDLGHWLNGGQRRLLSWSLRLSDCVVANARAVGELVERSERVPLGKLRVVPNGIDVARFDQLAARLPEPPLPALAPGLPRVAMVASMHLPDKGHADLLEAAALLRARGVEAEWLLVSDGALRAPLEQKAAALGLAGRVRFLGRRSDVPALLGQVDLVAHPSWAEGFPNAVLEAMCAQRAVVATPVGGIPEVLSDGETGLLVPPRHPEALAGALATLLADPDRRARMGALGRARIEQLYSLDRMRDTIDALYQNLTGSLS